MSEEEWAHLDELFSKAEQGDEVAFELLVHRFRPLIVELSTIHGVLNVDLQADMHLFMLRKLREYLTIDATGKATNHES